MLDTLQKKDEDGHRLMMQMCKPRRMERDGPVWWDVPDKRLRLAAYCKQDVRTERQIASRLSELSPRERKVYLLDQRINDRGVQIDVPLAQAALLCAETATSEANERLCVLTGGQVSAVTAVIDMTKWLRERGVQTGGVSKDHLRHMRTLDLSPVVREVLDIREAAARLSVAKLDSMLMYGQGDCRMRGLLAYHGAATGRWAGRGPQPQNFPRGTVPNVEQFLPAIEARDVELIDLCYPPLEVLSSALRSMIIAAPGHRLIAGDYNAIEARVLAWLAGNNALLDIFRQGGDPYAAQASTIYDVPVKRVSKSQRAVGKQAVLGLGYQMGWLKFMDTCAKVGIVISEECSRDVVRAYRSSNPSVVLFWRALEEAVVAAMRTPKLLVSMTRAGVVFQRRDEWLYLQLPSGRTLKYAEPRLTVRELPWGGERECVVFQCYDSVTRQWHTQQLYGGLLTENIVQATARDLLVDAMVQLEEQGFPIVLTVHDEIVSEVPVSSPRTLREFEEIMARVPVWAAGCPVKVEAWEGERYRK